MCRVRGARQLALVRYGERPRPSSRSPGRSSRRAARRRAMQWTCLDGTCNVRTYARCSAVPAVVGDCARPLLLPLLPRCHHHYAPFPTTRRLHTGYTRALASTRARTGARESPIGSGFSSSSSARRRPPNLFFARPLRCVSAGPSAVRHPHPRRGDRLRTRANTAAAGTSVVRRTRRKNSSNRNERATVMCADDNDSPSPRALGLMALKKIWKESAKISKFSFSTKTIKY